MLVRNLAGIPFPSSRFFHPIWREEVRERLRWLERPEKQGAHLLLPVLLGLVSGETLFLQKVGKIWQGVFVNGEEHVAIVAEGVSWKLLDFWEVANFWDDAIEKRVDYAYDPRWGYLTASPSRLGTGCKAYLWIHLPALSFLYGEERILQWLKESGNLSVRGLGDNGGICAHTFEVSNRFTLGVSEWEAVKMVETLGVRALKWERQARLHFGASPARVGDFWGRLEAMAQKIFQSDENVEKGVFDFLSLWSLGEEEGIIEKKGGLSCTEIENVLRRWLSTDVMRRGRVEALKTLGIWPRRILNHV